jgi:hypothetical protein
MSAFSVAQNMFRKDGSTYKKYRARCKLCLKDQVAKHNKVWYERNLEEIRAKAREKWREMNPPKEPKPKRTKEEMREYQKRYYEENKAYYKEYAKAYYAENKDKITSHVRKWIDENKERHNATRLKWREQNRERICAQQKANHLKRFLESPDTIRKLRNEKKKRLRAKDPQAWNEKMRKYNLLSQRKMVEQLTDAYVRQRITRQNDGGPIKISAKDVPQELVKAKRLQLLIRRSLKNEEHN